jgi:hypothetical protein
MFVAFMDICILFLPTYRIMNIIFIEFKIKDHINMLEFLFLQTFNIIIC